MQKHTVIFHTILGILVIVLSTILIAGIFIPILRAPRWYTLTAAATICTMSILLFRYMRYSKEQRFISRHIPINTKKAYEQFQHVTVQLNFIGHIIVHLIAQPTLTDMLDNCILFVTELYNADAGLFYLYDSENTVFRLRRFRWELKSRKFDGIDIIAADTEMPASSSESDIRMDEEYLHRIMTKKGYMQYHIIYIRLHDNTLGALIIMYTKPHLLHEREQQFFTMLSYQIGALLERFLLIETLEKKNQTIQTINERTSLINDLIAQANEVFHLNSFLDYSIKSIVHGLHLKIGALYITQQNSPYWHHAAHYHYSDIPAYFPECLELKPDVKTTRHDLKTLYFMSLQKDISYYTNTGHRIKNIRRLAFFPIIVKNELIGLLEVGGESHRILSNDEIDFMTTIIEHLGIIITNIRLFDMTVEQNRTITLINKELDDFTYSISHDLTEPLRGIEAFSMFLYEDYGDSFNTEGKEYLEKLQYNAKRLTMLIKHLLELSRIARTKNAREKVDVTAVLNDIQSLMQFTLEEKNAQLIIEGPFPLICGDRDRIYQLFQNCIGNALRYNAHTTPKIIVGRLPEETPNRCTFFIRDNGIGIEPDYIENIFDIFFQVNPHTQSQGSGMGLAICKKIVERYGGEIWVDSTPGKGTTFYFTLPVYSVTIL